MTNPTSGSALRSGITFGMFWLLGLWWVAGLYLGFRETSTVEILGRLYEGPDAPIALGIAALLPVTLLALALQNLFKHFQGRRGQ